ncbi:MarR family winged helix-turn-helix transcriptional regulator [Burkholderia sp. Bp9143]|uniref:MarR family winged helix-turn-helix transcriptional regulator n=1 Tax=Burkholderia sp. Bp9143 TaxID=2184574 RepID=UPI001C8AFBC5|nr:MarR family transcriptional regulator [Burkholderia sp. Bp9143]
MPRTSRSAKSPAETRTTASKPSSKRSSNDGEYWDQRLGFLMHDVSRLRRTVFDQYVRPLNVTRSQWWVLAHLARHDGMIQTDLADLLELGKAALGSLVDRLEASGLVVRRADEIDRRVKRIYLSPSASKLIAEMRVYSNEMSERILKGLTDEDRHTLVDLLTIVKENLRALAKESE